MCVCTHTHTHTHKHAYLESSYLNTSSVLILLCTCAQVSVAAGGLHTCAARASGEIDCWGDVPTDFPKDNAKIVAAVDGGGGSSSSSIGSDELGMKAAKAMTIDARRSAKQQLGSMLASVKSAVSGLFAAPANATNATEL